MDKKEKKCYNTSVTEINKNPISTDNTDNTEPFVLIAPGFSETPRHFKEGANVVDHTRDYARLSVEESRVKDIEDECLLAIQNGNKNIILIAHSISTGPALIASANIKKIYPDINIQVEIDSPIGITGPKSTLRLVRGAFVKSIRNIYNASIQTIDETQPTRKERLLKVFKDMGRAAVEIAHVGASVKEISYASSYSIADSLKTAVLSGVDDVHIKLNRNDDIEDANRQWLLDSQIPTALVGEDGEMQDRVRVSVRLDSLRRHPKSRVLRKFGRMCAKQSTNPRKVKVKRRIQGHDALLYS